jgi:hypothetical protein
MQPDPDSERRASGASAEAAAPAPATSCGSGVGALPAQGAPWSVRLACKLVRQCAAGASSPWAPYLRVLPRHVPTPLDTFSWEQLEALRYSPVAEAFHAADWLRSDAAAHSSEEARGGLGGQELYWALSVRPRLHCC